MSNKIEYSRFRFKRSTVVGVEPTIPTGDTIDNTWLSTDLLVGEGFINVADDKFWFRTENGIVEVSLSGISSDNYYTELAYLSGNTIVFDRNDTAEAYAVDLTPILSGATGDYLPLSGSAEMTGNFTAQTIYMDSNKNIQAVAGGGSIELGVKGDQDAVRITTDGTSGGDTFIHITPTEVQSRIGGNRWLVATSGGTTANNSDHISTILSGRFGKVNSGVVNSVILGGNALTASTSNTAYVDNLNIATVGAGTALYNLAIDANGDVIQGTGGISGDTSVGEFSATSVSILNSGATAREYFDYSSNTVETGVTNSAIVAGSGNTISSGLRNVFVSGVDLSATTNDTAYFSNIVGAPYDFTFAASDETTALTSGTSKIALYASRDFTISKVKVSLTTTGSTTTTVDVNVGGASILSAPIDLSSGVYVNSTTSLATSAISEDDRITVDIDAAGTDAAGLKIYLIGKNS